MSGRRRHWPLEALRGWAVLLMIHYHFMWDLSFFGLYSGDLDGLGWTLWSRTWQTVFVGLVGVSIAFAGQRRGPAERDRNWYRRGGQLLAIAIAITVVTRVVLGDDFILFGILHLAGVTMLLAPWLWRIRYVAPFIGAGIIWLAAPLANISVHSYWLVPFGVSPEFYPAVDFFPLVPWLGVVMTGMGIGLLLQRRWSGFAAESPRVPALMRPLLVAGRHSLLIYIVHQPILLAGFWLFGYTMW